MRDLDQQLVEAEPVKDGGFSERYTAGVSRCIYNIYAGFRILISVIDHQSTSAETDMNVAEDDDTGKHACIK